MCSYYSQCLDTERRAHRHTLVDSRRKLAAPPSRVPKPVDRLIKLRHSIISSKLFAARFVSHGAGMTVLGEALLSSDPMCRLEAISCLANLLGWSVISADMWRSLGCYVVSLVVGFGWQMQQTSLACLANAALCGVDHCCVLSRLLAPQAMLECVKSSEPTLRDCAAYSLAMFLFRAPSEVIAVSFLDYTCQSLLEIINDSDMGDSFWLLIWAVARLADGLNQQSIEQLLSLLLHRLLSSSLLSDDISVWSHTSLRSLTCQLRAMTALSCVDPGLVVICEWVDTPRLLYSLITSRFRHLRAETLPLVANLMCSSRKQAHCVVGRLQSGGSLFNKWISDTVTALFPFGV